MNLAEVQEEIRNICEDLCTKNNKWCSVEFTNRKTSYLGKYIGYSQPTLRFSNHYLEDFGKREDRNAIKQLAIHEVAHALTPSHHHDYVWRAKVRELGGIPERTTKTRIKPYKYVYECPHCHKQVKRMRKWTKDFACSSCCKKYNNGKWSNDYKFQLLEVLR